MDAAEKSEVIQSAIDKAKAIAAKFLSQNNGKRSADDDVEDENDLENKKAKREQDPNEAYFTEEDEFKPPASYRSSGYDNSDLHGSSIQRLGLGSEQRSSNTAPQASFSEDMKVPQKSVGLIIGKGGETLKRISRETNVKVSVANECEGDSDQRIITLSGDKESIQKAKLAIQDILSSESGSGSNQIVLDVPSFKVGLIIGRGGETIQMLQQKTGAKISVERTDAPDRPPNTRLVSISGSKDGMEHAKAMILEIIDDHQRSNMQSNPSGGYQGHYGPSGGSSGSQMGQNRNSVSEVMFVPNDKVGLVIGKGGETVKALSRQFQCKIDIQSAPGPEGRSITISGPAECIEPVKQAIMEKTGSRRQENNPYQGGGGYGGYANYGQQSYQQSGYYQVQDMQAYNNQYVYGGQEVQAAAPYDASQMSAETAQQYADYYAQYANDPNYAAWYAQTYGHLNSGATTQPVANASTDSAN